MLSLEPPPVVLPVAVNIHTPQLPGIVLHMLLDTGSTNSSLFLDTLDVKNGHATFTLWPASSTNVTHPSFTLPVSATGKVVTKYGVFVRPYVRLDVTLDGSSDQIPSKQLQLSLQTGRSFGKYNGILGLDYMAGIPNMVLDLVASDASEKSI